jgi:adenylate kinase
VSEVEANHKTIMKNLFVFLGAPGSGKGSLSRLCVDQFGWVQLSTGDLCRKHISEQTEIGKKIDFAIKSGKLVTDSLIADMVQDWFESVKDDTKSVILDGYPRTVAQAQFLCDFLRKNDGKIRLHIIRFFISDFDLIERLSKRLICQNKQCQAIYAMNESEQQEQSLVCEKCDGILARRSDDAPDVVRRRLSDYSEHERGLLDFYGSMGQPVSELIADKPLMQVFEDFKNIASVKSV